MSDSKNNELIAIFDIGSGSVGGALVLMPKEEGSNPVFLASYRFPVLFKKDLDASQFQKLMLKAVKIVASKISIARPDNAYCFLASPWSAHQTRLVNFKNNSPLISRKEIDQIVSRELRNFHDSYIKEYPENSLIEAKIENLLLKKTKPLEKKLAMFLATADQKLTVELEKIIRSSTGAFNVISNSFLLSDFAVVRNFLDPKNFVLIDIGGGVTEVGIVRDDILIESGSFPFGKNTLIRRLATVAPEGAETLISLFFDNRLEEKSRIQVEKLLKIEKKHFQEHLMGAFGDLNVAGEPIFLTVDDEVANWFTEAISTLTKKPNQCIFLESRTLHSFCDLKSKVAHDPFLIIEALSLQAHEI